jgi:Tfp pilus assembly protein PilF
MRALTILIAIVAMIATPAIAQKGSSRGSMPNPEIHGQVRLPSGYSAGVGLRVELEGRSTGLHTESMTDSSGRFLFRGLTPDTYQVKVSGQGLHGESDLIPLENTRVGFVNIELKPTKAAVRTEPGAGVVSAAEAGIPEEAKTEFASGEELLKVKGDPKGSLKHFKKATETYPQFARAHLMMGLAHMELTDWSSAQGDLERAIAMDEKMAQAQLALGSTLIAQGKLADAEPHLKRGLELDPQSGLGFYELGRVHWSMGRRQEAQAEAEQALKLQPDLSEAHLLLGNALLHSGRTDDAMKEYNEYLRLDPKGRFAEPTRAMVQKVEHARSNAKK